MDASDQEHRAITRAKVLFEATGIHFDFSDFDYLKAAAWNAARCGDYDFHEIFDSIVWAIITSPMRKGKK